VYAYACVVMNKTSSSNSRGVGARPITPRPAEQSSWLAGKDGAEMERFHQQLRASSYSISLTDVICDILQLDPKARSSFDRAHDAFVAIERTAPPAPLSPVPGMATSNVPAATIPTSSSFALPSKPSLHEPPFRHIPQPPSDASNNNNSGYVAVYKHPSQVEPPFRHIPPPPNDSNDNKLVVVVATIGMYVATTTHCNDSYTNGPIGWSCCRTFT
jgi:hypothetical protein